MPKIALESVPQTNATGYPAPLAAPVQERWYRRLAPASGLEDFGVSHVVLKPGAWSGHRHWHEDEDEFVVVVAGKAILVDDDGRTPLNPGDCIAYPKNEPNGHHIVNESDQDCVFIAVGRVADSDCHYPDVDMHLFAGKGFRRKDGSEY